MLEEEYFLKVYWYNEDVQYSNEYWEPDTIMIWSG